MAHTSQVTSHNTRLISRFSCKTLCPHQRFASALTCGHRVKVVELPLENQPLNMHQISQISSTTKQSKSLWRPLGRCLFKSVTSSCHGSGANCVWVDRLSQHSYLGIVRFCIIISRIRAWFCNDLYGLPVTLVEMYIWKVKKPCVLAHILNIVSFFKLFIQRLYYFFLP